MCHYVSVYRFTPGYKLQADSGWVQFLCQDRQISWKWSTLYTTLLSTVILLSKVSSKQRSFIFLSLCQSSFSSDMNLLVLITVPTFVVRKALLLCRRCPPRKKPAQSASAVSLISPAAAGMKRCNTFRKAIFKSCYNETVLTLKLLLRAEILFKLY